MKAVKKEYKEILPKWNLDDLYNGNINDKIKSDLAKNSKEALSLEKEYQNKIINLSGDDLYQLIIKYENISQNLGRIMTYSYLYFVTDMTNPKRSSFYQDNSEAVNKIYKSLLFVSLEIAALNEQRLKIKFDESLKLQKYKPYIRDVRVSAKYQKSKEIEKILFEKSQTSNSAWSRLFDEQMADMKFSYNRKKLNISEIFDLLSSQDANIRKKAAQSIGKSLKDNIKLLSFITNILAKDKAIDDEIRNYPHPAKARHINNFIEDNIIDCLSDTIEKNYENFSHRYYKLKAQIFGKEKLDYWDRNAPFPEEKEQKISWEKAQNIVLEAYQAFNPKMAEIAQMFFDCNWIDAAPSKGKDFGAFSHPATTDTHPYIMLNYQGKVRDVMTLAHELGHGIHQYLSRENGYFMADTPLTLAETASIFGEQLTFESLLKICKNNEEKKYLIANKIEDSINTIIRQNSFYKFELEIHKQRRIGELKPQEICDIWISTQSKSLGPAIKLDKLYQYYWSYIPHFIHSPFYVYAYSFGNCLVNSLYKTYKDDPKDFDKKYLKTLSHGGTLHHKDLLKPYNLKASDSDFWQKGLELPIEYINQLEILVKN